MIKIFKHLLPTGRAWRLTIDKPLRRLVEGLSSAAQDTRDYIDARYLDLFPYTSTTLEEWAGQFGVGPTAEAVDAAWKATGGQSMSYVQSVLAAAGFDVTIRTFWVEGTGPGPGTETPPGIRNPQWYLDWAGWDPEASGERLIDGPGYVLLDGETRGEAKGDASRWPFYIYVSDASTVFPRLFFMDPERLKELEALLLRLIPAQQWIGVLITSDLDWYDENGIILCNITIDNCKRTIPCH